MKFNQGILEIFFSYCIGFRLLVFCREKHCARFADLCANSSV